MDAVHRPTVRYVPGSWVALSGADVWLLADVAAGSPVVTTCWEAIEQGAGFDHLLGIILREGLRTVPSFALAGRSESGMRILVEGKARAEMRMPGSASRDSDATLVTADGAATWTERRVDGPIDLRLLSADETSGAQLALSGGVVLAAELSLVGVRADAPLRPAMIVPMPDPPIVAADPSGRETFRKPGGVVGLQSAAHRAVSPETLQAPIEPAPHPPTLDHVGAELPADALPPRVPATPPPPPQGAPVPDMPPPTMHVPGLVESMPTPPDSLAHERTGEIAPPAGNPAADTGAPADRPWAPPAGPPALSTSIAGIEGTGPGPYTVERSAVPGATPELDAQTAPTVQAILCPNQHLNPPYAGQCRLCGAPVAHQASFGVPRPTLGVLTLSTGELVPLDRDVVLGRAPFHPDASGAARPHLVQLPSPGNDISRSHVRVSLEGWHVQVVDLGSINGTVVSLPGQAPVRLRAHDPFTIVAGTTISLADEVTARFDVIVSART